jgi:N-hydroxyarylamine O-acetyltransferase
MNVPDYLSRIGYMQSSDVNQETLRGLHVAHLLTVPFENLDIGLHHPIHLDQQSLWNKIVIQRRGGFCYELNGLFAWLLKEIGFEVTCLNARVFNQNGELGIEFDHLALLIDIPNQTDRWLADVGFGDSFMEPLNFEERGEQEQGLRAYRLEQTSAGYITWQKNYDGSWEHQYFFNLQPHKFPSDYEAGCLYHQTSPKSSFTRGSIISRAIPEGRVSLDSDKLIITRNGQREVKSITDEERTILLEEHFGVVL